MAHPLGRSLQQLLPLGHEVFDADELTVRVEDVVRVAWALTRASDEASCCRRSLIFGRPEFLPNVTMFYLLITVRSSIMVKEIIQVTALNYSIDFSELRVVQWAHQPNR